MEEFVNTTSWFERYTKKLRLEMELNLKKKIHYLLIYTYIPWIEKSVKKTVECGTSHKYTNIQI